MGITPEGLQVRRYSDILSDLVTSLKTNIDPLIDTGDDKFLGQVLQEFALAGAGLEDLAEAVNDNFNIFKAEGIYLDSLAVFRNITRIQSAYSATAFQLFTGDDGTTIPANSLIDSAVSGERFKTLSDVLLTTTSCKSATYSVRTLLNSTLYTLTVNGVLYSFTSDASATELEILSGLKALIDSDTTKTWTATVDAAELTITVATSNASNIELSSATYLGADSVSTHSSISAIVSGKIIAPANTITEIISSVGGWESTSNTQDLIVGRDQETDDDFRARIVTTEQLSNVGTLTSITSRIRNIPGVSSVVVEENDTGTVDGFGRPPHAIEVIVQGGNDDSVATEIFDTKAAGIPTFGNTTTLITDSENTLRTINYTRPVVQNIAIQVTYSQYTEETLPIDVVSAIKGIVKTEINALGLGVDVIPKRLSGPLYSGLTGLDDLVIEVQEIIASGDTPVGGSWQTSRYPISSAEYANTELVDIYVVPI